ncbi:hypothetical protein [Roseiterribacter gracilis]|uniref:Uncharacterized protein n=1 Tax=Roseiterribacter gracilis TaxID=2812848 RepID=A0A8S8XAA3_9PROT|nr:hypothetical protein TMPK1_12290 [Rhodospirillales bacterium TMPK1]
MSEANQHHAQILSASTNLLGICFVVIGSLKLTNSNSLTIADEIAWVASILLFTSTIAAYLTIRNDVSKRWVRNLADRAFIAGACTLMASVLSLVIEL